MHADSELSFQVSHARAWIHMNVGWLLCADELFSPWLGKDGGKHSAGMPHVTKIPRKPKGIGCEMKCVCDSATGIMLHLEVQKGEAAQKRREFARNRKAGTAVLMRMTKAFFASRRTVCADSAFASVEAAVALRQNGLHFLGMVKTSHKLFPRAYLQQKALYQQRGDIVVVETECQGFKLLGVGWKDAKIQTIVATRGVTIAGPDHLVMQPEWTGPGETTMMELRIPQPQVVAEYYEGAKGVDAIGQLSQPLTLQTDNKQ